MTAVSDRGNSHVEFLKTDDDLPPWASSTAHR